MLLECQALLSDDPDAYAAPLEELSRQMLQQLVPPLLHPQDPTNELLKLEQSFADGLAELERAGYRTEGISAYDYFHRLAHLEKRANKSD